MRPDYLMPGIRTALGPSIPGPVVEDLVSRAELMGIQDVGAAVLQWLNTKPPFAYWFNKADTVTVAASASRTTIGEAAFRIPAGCVGVLHEIANSIFNPISNLDIVFALLVDDSPLTGFSHIVGPVATARAPLFMQDGLASNQLVRWVATNRTAVAVPDVYALVRGWFWPVTLNAPM